MTAPVLVAAPCSWKQTAWPEPCGEVSTHLVFSGRLEHMSEQSMWRPLCEKHLRINGGCVGVVYDGVVDVLAATPIGGERS